MSSRSPTTPGAWHSFVDAWAQYHGVEMSEQARAVLCTAMGHLTEAELAAIRSCPAVERVTDERGIIYRPQHASQPLQSIATPSAPARLPRTPPRTPPRTAPSAAPTGSRPPARIVRRTAPVK